MSAVDASTYTPYSTAKPLLGNDDLELWAPELDRDRIAAYQLYDEIYWSHNDVFKLVQRGEDSMPIYMPVPQTIVDTTAHFWGKGMEVVFGKDAEDKSNTTLQEFLAREMFLSKVAVAKHSGVARGDFVLHLTADPAKPDGSRVSVNSVDPGAYFPEFDDDDLERVLAVNLVEQIIDDKEPTKMLIRRLRYEYEGVEGRRRVTSQEAVYEVKDWFKGTRVKRRTISEKKMLPERINVIPVYHFKNKDWQGQPFGSSELRGYERVLAGINQGISDEELALALDGLGVYATDAGKPVDKDGNSVSWHMGPGRVIELGGGTFFKRVEGNTTVEPFQAHLGYLQDTLFEASGTFRGSNIDANVAESGIALAIRFLPTEAKLEQRDIALVEKMTQFFFDWKNWIFVYENINIGDVEIKVVLGEKLPTNKLDMLNVLNNLLDRKVMDRQMYREEITKLYGIEFKDPEAIDKRILDDMEKFTPAPLVDPNNPDQNNSNNKNRPNESGGTEATQKTSDQTQQK